MADRYQCTLTPEALKKAVEELNEPEDNDLRLAAIDKLRTRFLEETTGELELIRNDDAFILRFLRVRKFDADKAFNTLVNYHKQRKEWREVFDAVDDPKLVEDLLRVAPYITLRNGRAKDGSFVLIGRLGLGSTENTAPMHYIACLILTIEKILEQEESQIYGFTIIEDMSNFGLTMAMQMTTNGKKFMHIVQDCLPARVKQLNMVNEALVFDVIYAILSQFMKEKIKNRLILHGANYKGLQDQIDGSYLPFSLGGSGPDLNPDWWMREIISTEGDGEDTAM